MSRRKALLTLVGELQKKYEGADSAVKGNRNKTPYLFLIRKKRMHEYIRI